MKLTFAVLYVSRTTGLTHCYKTAAFTCICRFSTKLCYFSYRIRTLTLSEQFDRTLCQCQCNVVSAYQISPNKDHHCEVVIAIFTRRSATADRKCASNMALSYVGYAKGMSIWNPLGVDRECHKNVHTAEPSVESVQNDKFIKSLS